MRRIGTIFGLLLSLLALPWPAAARQAGGGSGQMSRTFVFSHKVALTLSIPSQVYPRNALVQVTVGIQNVSRRPLFLSPMCPPASLFVEVVRTDGTAAYPPALSGGPRPECAPVLAQTLAPGSRITRHVYVILRGSTIRVHVQVLSTKFARPPFVDVTAPGIRVRLVRGQAPQLQLIHSPILIGEVRPNTAGERGAPLYMESELCPNGNGSFSGGGSRDWERAADSVGGTFQFTPGCAHPLQWHLVVGWPDGPVVSYDYSSP